MVVVNTTSIVIRTSLVVATAVVAAVCPYFGSTIGTVGGITDAFQAFVLPCIIYINVAKESRELGQKVKGGYPVWVYWFVVAVGLAIMASTFWGVLSSLFGAAA